MADPTDKHPLNVSGPYYTDTTCIDCGLCREMAPSVFQADDEWMAYVAKQPVGREESEATEEALESCPVECIGKTPWVDGGE